MLYQKKQQNKAIIKICGVANSLPVYDQVDYLGCMFVPTSSRYISAVQAAKIHTRSIKVGVVMNHTLKEIINLSETSGIKIFQLHGDESPELCQDLQTHGFIVRKALAAEKLEPNTINTYQKYVDLFIFDGSLPGSGKSYNYEILRSVEVPFLVAGGLTTENAYDVYMSLPACVGIDISSGVEEGGVKDERKVSQLLKTFSRSLIRK